MDTYEKQQKVANKTHLTFLNSRFYIKSIGIVDETTSVSIYKKALLPQLPPFSKGSGHNASAMPRVSASLSIALLGIVVGLFPRLCP